MAGNRRTLTLEEVRRRAADLDGMFEDYQEQQALESRFSGVASTTLVESWETGKNEDGKRMTRFEWMKRFGCEPPWDTAEPKRAQPTDPEPADDTIIYEPEVRRLTGTSPSGLKRLRRAGDFPEPTRISQRRIGWRAGVVKAWVDERTNRRTERPDFRRKAR
jgi:predicted DNA-binding transcriptional regulator AlpA